MFTKYELGQKTAVSLINEMRFLGKLKQDHNLDDLLEQVPIRDVLGFQVIGKLDAAKSNETKGNFGAELAGLRFCVGDGSVEKINMMDIDHTVPFNYIRKKQMALLNYLNNPLNMDFKIGFLSVDNINNYFKEEAGVVKGTRRFFRLCYNDIDNLLLLCHACNEDKGAKESLKWFSEQEPFLGKKFVDAVEQSGGLHDGIIVKKICKTASIDGGVVKIGEFECVLHEGQCLGLGEFVNNWFESEYPGYAKDVVEAYKSVWLELKEVYELQLKYKANDDKTKSKGAQAVSIKLTSMIAAQIKIVEERYKLTVVTDSNIMSQSSHSSGDDSVDQKSRIEEINHKIRQVLNYMHGLKKIQTVITQNDHSLATRENKMQLYSYYKTLGIRELDFEKQEKFFNETAVTLKQLYSTGKTFSVDDIKQIIREIAQKYSLTLQLQQLQEIMQEKEKIIQEKEKLVQEKEKLVQEKDKAMQEKDKAMQEKDKEIFELKAEKQQLQSDLDEDRKKRSRSVETDPNGPKKKGPSPNWS